MDKTPSMKIISCPMDHDISINFRAAIDSHKTHSRLTRVISHTFPAARAKWHTRCRVAPDTNYDQLSNTFDKCGYKLINLETNKKTALSARDITASWKPQLTTAIFITPAGVSTCVDPKTARCSRTSTQVFEGLGMRHPAGHRPHTRQWLDL